MKKYNRIILKLHCPDQVGIVAKVTTLIAKHQGSIVEANQYGDLKRNRFFMRVEIDCDESQSLQQALPLLADELSMTWTITNRHYPKKVVIFAGKQEHCLADLLSRANSGDLNMDLIAVVSNYLDHEKLVQAYGIPYKFISFDNNDVAFAEINTLLQETTPDLMILARFMRIFPESICNDYAGRMINIHHSFLPSFIGANPYEQAFDKGVKMIGATCHYVTKELDHGPIIEQDTIHISHMHSLEQIKQMGRDIEKTVLARGTRYHLEDRIMLNGNKTIIFG